MEITSSNLVISPGTTHGWGVCSHSLTGERATHQAPVRAHAVRMKTPGTKDYGPLLNTAFWGQRSPKAAGRGQDSGCAPRWQPGCGHAELHPCPQEGPSAPQQEPRFHMKPMERGSSNPRQTGPQRVPNACTCRPPKRGGARLLATPITISAVTARVFSKTQTWRLLHTWRTRKPLPQAV